MLTSLCSFSIHGVYESVLACLSHFLNKEINAFNTYMLRARNILASPRGNFRDNVFIKAKCMASILVGWLQLASRAFVCYLAVKYATLKIKNNFGNTLKVNILSSEIKYVMFFGGTVQVHWLI